MQASTSLWRSGTFARLWMGQTFAAMAAQISFLAVPLVATVTLNATPMEMGVLTALASLPTLLLGLQTGAIVDRHKRRPIMIGADLFRAIALALIPLAWWFDLLSISLLGIIVVLSGIGSLAFDVSYQALLPSLVPRTRLADANGKLELSRTATELAAPGVAGNLVQAIGAPVAILANAGLYALSAIAVWSIRIREQIVSPPHEESTGVWTRVRIGLDTVWRSGLLRAVVISRAVLAFYNAALEAVFILYVVGVLGVSPALLGIIFGVGGLGFLVGALLPQTINRRLGIGTATALSAIVIGGSDLLVPLAGNLPALVVPLLVAAQFLFGVGLTVFNVNQTSLRQSLVPDHLQGRAGATSRFLVMTVVPVGALIGGLIGALLGLQETLVIAAAGEMLAAVWIWRSPLRALRLPFAGRGPDVVALEPRFPAYRRQGRIVH